MSDKQSILIVDDDSEIVDLMELLLAPFNIEIHRTDNVGSAKEILLEHDDVALIISDINMPGERGVALLEWAKNNKPEIGRLIITGQGGGLTPVEIGKAEAMQVIEKPFKRLSQLIATVMGYFALNVRAPFVVVADESKHFRDMVIKAFKSSDVVAVPVKTIPSLYQVLQNHTPAAVLFDSIGSPDTLNDVCSLYGDKFPLIICTETSAAQRDEYLNAGASDVLQKPVSEAILLECVKKYLPASYREISV